jgi:hypothetical protein
MQFSDDELRLMRDVFHNQETDNQARSDVAKRLSDYFNLPNETNRQEALWDKYNNMESDDAMNWLWEALVYENVIPDGYENMSTEDIIQEAIDTGDLSLDAFEEILEDVAKIDQEEQQEGEVDGEEQTEGATNEIER